ncbi:DUF6292 family protein [Saccharopolyspora halophila]|uniref:DUF6292 family protein n=1 Tax=Saccharopolyspora halophila TaxID=405551 RepID=A0ABP5TX21_9PSEU
MDMTLSVVNGLVNYVRSVTAGMEEEMGVVDLEVGDELTTVIILVKSRVPALAELPLLLTWDEVSGWALRVGTGDDGDTTPLAYLGEDVLPHPRTVQEFLREALRGASPGRVTSPAFRVPNARDGLEQRLERLPGEGESR